MPSRTNDAEELPYEHADRTTPVAVARSAEHPTDSRPRCLAVRQSRFGFFVSCRCRQEREAVLARTDGPGRIVNAMDTVQRESLIHRSMGACRGTKGRPVAD